MLGFAEKTISTLSKQPMKLSFVASYSTEEENFNAAIKVSTEGTFSPQKSPSPAKHRNPVKSQSTSHPRFSGSKIRAVEPVGQSPNQMSNQSFKHRVMSPDSIKKPPSQFMPVTENIKNTKAAPQIIGQFNYSVYALENGISGPLPILKKEIENCISKTLVKEYKVKRLPENEYQSLCVLTCIFS